MLRSLIIYFLGTLIFYPSVDALGQQRDTTAVVSPSRPDSLKNEAQKDSVLLKRFRQAFKRIVDNKKKSQQASISQEAQDPKLNLKGFILDETRTRMGRNFYTAFYQKWEYPKGVENFTITITEQPTIGRGSLISIKVDYEPIYQARLQPGQEYIEAISEQAIRRTHYVLQRKSAIQQQYSGF